MHSEIKHHHKISSPRKKNCKTYRPVNGDLGIRKKLFFGRVITDHCVHFPSRGPSNMAATWVISSRAWFHKHKFKGSPICVYQDRNVTLTPRQTSGKRQAIVDKIPQAQRAVVTNSQSSFAGRMHRDVRNRASRNICTSQPEQS